MKFQIHNAKGQARNEVYFTLVADNGEVIATSETYQNKLDAFSTINSIKARASSAVVNDHTYEPQEAKKT
jgi:uncharacterized protein YegP (UPF0339 family)